MHRRIVSAGLAILFGLAAAACANERSEPATDEINAIIRSLSEISGLKEKHPVPCGRMSKRQLRQFLSKRIKKTLQPEEIRSDELVLKLFGLVPQNFDLKKSTVDLLTEQAAAFYDYDEKKLFLLPDSESDAEITTLAHELSHALADQHFDLERFMEDSSLTDDQNLARTAVVEGQASWLMLAYDLKAAGKPPVPTEQMLKSVGDASEASIADYPVLKASPLYIQQSLLFPYAQGTLFFDAVYKRMGKSAFSEVFRHAPADSAQILHPELYFRNVKPTLPQLPKPALKNFKGEIASGSVGEFDHQILLQQYVGAAAAAALAPHLRGGHFRVVVAGRKRSPVLEYASEWDSADSARQFFKAYKRILKAKWKRCDPVADTPALFAGTGDNGYFVSRSEGATVSSVEGIGDGGDWRRLQQAQPDTAAALAVSPQS